MTYAEDLIIPGSLQSGYWLISRTRDIILKGVTAGESGNYYRSIARDLVLPLTSIWGTYGVQRIRDIIMPNLMVPYTASVVITGYGTHYGTMYGRRL